MNSGAARTNAPPERPLGSSCTVDVVLPLPLPGECQERPLSPSCDAVGNNTLGGGCFAGRPGGCGFTARQGGGGFARQGGGGFASPGGSAFTGRPGGCAFDWHGCACGLGAAVGAPVGLGNLGAAGRTACGEFNKFRCISATDGGGCLGALFAAAGGGTLGAASGGSATDGCGCLGGWFAAAGGSSETGGFGITKTGGFGLPGGVSATDGCGALGGWLAAAGGKSRTYAGGGLFPPAFGGTRWGGLACGPAACAPSAHMAAHGCGGALGTWSPLGLNSACTHGCSTCSCWPTAVGDDAAMVLLCGGDEGGDEISAATWPPGAAACALRRSASH